MLKNILKLSLVLLIFSFSIISCSDEEILNIETEASNQAKLGFATTFDCPLDNQNRISESLNTYGSFNFTPNSGPDCDISGFPNLGCFPDELRKVIHSEFLKGPKGNSTQTNYTYSISNELLSEIEDIPNLDLFPYILPEYSNKVYRYIACEIQEDLSLLPALPSSQYYFPRATYVAVDFHPSGNEWNLSVVSFHYDVEIKLY